MKSEREFTLNQKCQPAVSTRGNVKGPGNFIALMIWGPWISISNCAGDPW